METHRCEGVLKRRVSIRKCNPYESLPYFDCGKDMWWMLKLEYYYDTNTNFLQPIEQIDFCPFCGVKL